MAAAVCERLALAGCVAADEEADELLASAPDAATLEHWVARRERGEPLAWITGKMHFCDRTVYVEPGVYVPRPQSEELVRRAARAAPARGRVADLCTGTGAIAASITASVPTAVVIATEIDLRAARCARRNDVHVVVSDLDGGLESGVFDVVTAVAPYVPSDALHVLPRDVQRYEPRVALDGGAGGLEVLRRVVAAAARLLVPGGWLFSELGAGQGAALEPVLETHRFGDADVWFDDEGDARGLAARLLR